MATLTGRMRLGITDKATVTITVSGIELLALKKLALVSHALAAKLWGVAGFEQKCLASTLDDLIRQIEIESLKGTP
jgi:hypothetical protein